MSGILSSVTPKIAQLNDTLALKVNQVVTRKDICFSKVSFHYAILGMMLG